MTVPSPLAETWEADSPWRRVAVAVLAGLFAWTLRVWSATWRGDRSGLRRLDELRAGGRPFMALFWHGAYLPLFALVEGRQATVLTARSLRGAVIAGICRRFGYRVVQVGEGRLRAGRRAVLEALALPGGLVATAADGPLGPAHRVKTGVIEVSVLSGAAILPVAAVSHRCIRLTGRWDRMEIPLPFSRVDVRVGDPIPPASLAAADRAAAVRLISEALDRLSWPRA